jgi:hypothetical protein
MGDGSLLKNVARACMIPCTGIHLALMHLLLRLIHDKSTPNSFGKMHLPGFLAADAEFITRGKEAGAAGGLLDCIWGDMNLLADCRPVNPTRVKSVLEQRASQHKRTRLQLHASEE